MFPGVPHIRYTYLNLLDSPELLQIRFLCFRFDALTELGAFRRTEFLWGFFCIKSYIGTQAEAGCP